MSEFDLSNIEDFIAAAKDEVEQASAQDGQAARIASALALTRASNASGPATAAISAGVFRADDGAAVYVSAVGSTVYAFAEHPGKDYAFVLRATHADGHISGQWWDVPKHSRATKGSVKLQVSQNANRLTRKSSDTAIGVSVLTRIDPANVPWPKTDLEAGFQSTRTSDLDGKFSAPGGPRTYLREVASDVVGVSELRTGSSARPQWVSVLIGQRQPNGGVSGSYADVPKGTRAASGGFGAAQVASTRRIGVFQSGVPSTGIQEPDYAVDFAQMRTLVSQALDGRVIGYGFAISKNDKIVAEGAGGSRRLAQDDPTGDNERLEFHTTTQIETASSAKLVTAAMLVRTLVEKGIRLGDPVGGGLPSCWERGPGIGTMSGLTWQQLLSHTSRLTRPSECSNNPYECLRKAVLAGCVGPSGRVYQNINYTILRYMIPILRNKAAVEAIFDKYGCKSSNGAEINADVSEMFRRYVSDEVLKPLGIVGTFEPVTEFAIRYNFSQPNAQGIRPSYNDILRAGSGGMKFSAHEYAKFLGALETGKIVPVGWLRTMRSELLGYDGRLAGAAGDYPWKNGGASGVETWTASFPSGVAAYIAVNSNNNNLDRSLGQILRDAFDASIK